MNLIRSDPFIAIDIQTHYDIMKRQKGLSSAQKQSLHVKARTFKPRPARPCKQSPAVTTEDPHIDYPYLQLPTPEHMNRLLGKYIDCTGNDALSKRICGCCGQRDFSSEFHPRPFSYHDLPPPGDVYRLPGQHLLQPEHLLNASAISNVVRSPLLHSVQVHGLVKCPTFCVTSLSVNACLSHAPSHMHTS